MQPGSTYHRRGSCRHPFALAVERAIREKGTNKVAVCVALGGGRKAWFSEVIRRVEAGTASLAEVAKLCHHVGDSVQHERELFLLAMPKREV